MDEKIKRARSYVLWLIARKDYSRRQLTEKLKKRELTLDEIKEMFEYLIENGWYNEGTFKKVRTRQLVKRGYGPTMIRAKLSAEKEQVSKEDITEAYDYLGTDQIKEIRTLIDKYHRRYSFRTTDPRELKNKIVQALMRKGFAYDQIVKGLKQD